MIMEIKLAGFGDEVDQEAYDQLCLDFIDYKVERIIRLLYLQGQMDSLIRTFCDNIAIPYSK